MKIKEAVFQKTCVAELRAIRHHLIPVAIQNETNTKLHGFGLIRHWKAMGKLWGCPDLMVFDKNKKTIYFLEFKAYNILKRGGYSPAGKQSDYQKEFNKLIEDIEYEYWLIDTPTKWEEFIKDKI